MNAQEKNEIQNLNENGTLIKKNTSIVSKFVPNEIIVHFLPNSIAFPEGVDSIETLNVKGNTEAIQFLQSVSTKKLKKVFKSFNVSDTIRTMENGSKVHMQDLSQVFIATFKNDIDVSERVAKFMASPNVIHAQPNYIYTTDDTPTDPDFSLQWGLEQTSGEDIDATTAWEIQTGSSNIKLGIFDTGIDYTNEDLGDGYGLNMKVRGGYDWVNNDSDPIDDRYHGTHVAGIAGALTNNTSDGQNVGISGVAGGWDYNRSTGSGNKGVQLFAMKVLGSDGNGNTATIANAVIEGADPSAGGWGYGINVLNLSLGNYEYDETMRSAVNYSARMGRVLVASKGNDNTTDYHYPSDYDNSWVLSVGATNQDGNKRNSSNYGNGIDVTAPGGSIYSTMPTYTTSAMNQYGYSQNYNYLSGTSMATPYVSGLAALLLSENSSLHTEEVQGIIRASADDKYTPGYDDLYGTGRINAGRALQYLQSPWTMNQYSVTGGSSIGNTDYYKAIFYNTGSLATGSYIVKRYDVRKTVNFANEYVEPPHVWGRGTNASTGWSAANPNYETGYCKVVSSSATSAELQTYVYEVWNISSGTRIGWYPTTPENAVFAYTVHGISPTHVSGDISTSTTWNGYYIVDDDVTITSGVTLTISPGTNLTFNNGASLIVNSYGMLAANGIEVSPITFDFVSSNSSTQNGIKFTTNMSMGTINYCQIRNAYRGIYEHSVSINIANTAITGCSNGIYLYSSSPQIYRCSILNNFTGINLLYSSPLIKENYIQNNDAGIYCSSSSHPKIGNRSTEVGNQISGNNYGIMVFYNALPIVGNSFYGGFNNIVNSTNLLNATGGLVYAQNNWWGSTSNFKINGPVIYLQFLPNAVGIDAPPLSKTVGDTYATSEEDVPMVDELNKAYELVASNNLTEARAICLNLVNNYPDYAVSYNALNLLKETYTENEFDNKKSTFKTVFKNKGKKDIYALAGLMLADLDKENKLKQIDEVIENYNGESIVELALFDKLVYYAFELQDNEKARAISNELDKQFPNSQGAIEGHKILGDEKYFGKFAMQKDNSQIVEENPAEFGLFDNYPNPFNPSTSIRYSLPYQSTVNLVIYDIMGREVKSFEVNSQSAGTHSIIWDGRNANGVSVSSGMYLYRISFKSLENSEEFVKTAKMVLLK